MKTNTFNPASESISVVTFLWNDGFREYLPAHVNKLAKMIKMYLPIPHRFICVTDETKGFSENVELFKLPADAEWVTTLGPPGKKHLPSSYRRLWLFSKEAVCLGDRVLMLDVDCLIVNDLTPLFGIPDDFVGWRPNSEWRTNVKAKVAYKRIGGGTWLLRTGTHTFIWEKFSPQGILDAKEQGWTGSDQAWLSYNLARNCAVFPPDMGIYHTQDGAKHWDKLPENAKIIHFNGAINPWDEQAQSRPWVCRLLGVAYQPKRWSVKPGGKLIKPLKIPQPEQRPFLNVVIYWWGNWPDGEEKLGIQYVDRLVRGLERYLPDYADYKIILFTDHARMKFAGVDVRKLEVPEDLRWNLKKMFMYSGEAQLKGPTICFDLDCVIVGNLSPLVSEVLKMHNKWLITCSGAYRRKQIGGSIVGFNASRRLRKALWVPILKNRAEVELATKGSERAHYKKQLKVKRVAFWDRRIPGMVLSYKQDCKTGLPEFGAVVRFHGSPRPHEVDDEWVKENWV